MESHRSARESGVRRSTSALRRIRPHVRPSLIIQAIIATIAETSVQVSCDGRCAPCARSMGHPRRDGEPVALAGQGPARPRVLEIRAEQRPSGAGYDIFEPLRCRPHGWCRPRPRRSPGRTFGVRE